MSDEQKLKVSLSRKGKCLGNTNGFKAGQKGPRTGVQVSNSTKLKMRLAKLGTISNHKGHKNSPKSREKQSISRKQYFKKVNHQYVERSGKHDDVRKERIKQNGGCHSLGEWERLKAQYNWKCPKCSKSEPDIKLTRDHIVPISMGGSDNIENIQPLCIRCNSSKGVLTQKY